MRSRCQPNRGDAAPAAAPHTLLANMQAEDAEPEAQEDPAEAEQAPPMSAPVGLESNPCAC